MEYVAVDEEAPLTRVPDTMDLDVAAALPTIGVTGLALTSMLAPLKGRTVLIVGARGGVGCSSACVAALFSSTWMIRSWALAPIIARPLPREARNDHGSITPQVLMCQLIRDSVR
ncbi:hypothetical protein CLM62_23310 [Streptomyces sp. SA15]|uniref:hypothetical protein n=1 Tax=Streptomyces sp. SA15 TaxID=934019 RepID=UPI000BAFFA0E|nr:hypothetical protein [Streptomyces sp. SA15]PAZ13626.1 hypothetical protein CLM62_23310 [Streptomyces sp. SA15]